jgi:hypothetical protein
MNEAVEVLADSGAVPDRHFQSVYGEVRSQAVRDLPSHHHSREHVDDEGGVHPSGIGLHIGEVRNPQPVRCLSFELAFDQVTRTVLTVI